MKYYAARYDRFWTSYSSAFLSKRSKQIVKYSDFRSELKPDKRCTLAETSQQHTHGYQLQLESPYSQERRLLQSSKCYGGVAHQLLFSQMLLYRSYHECYSLFSIIYSFHKHGNQLAAIGMQNSHVFYVCPNSPGLGLGDGGCG